MDDEELRKLADILGYEITDERGPFGEPEWEYLLRLGFGLEGLDGI